MTIVCDCRSETVLAREAFFSTHYSPQHAWHSRDRDIGTAPERDNLCCDRSAFNRMVDQVSKPEYLLCSH